MIKTYKQWGTIVIISLSLIEMLTLFSLENAWATIILICGWFLLSYYFLNNQVLDKYPISFFMVWVCLFFGFNLPLPLTLIELKPVTFNLKLRFETFLHHGLVLMALIISHVFIEKHSVVKIFR